MFDVLFFGIIIGFVFGVALESSRVYKPDIIIGQLLFKRFTMIKVIGTAILTSTIVIAMLEYAGHYNFYLKPFNLVSNILGGVLLGAGIALTGACPGTVYAQMGAGYKDAYYTFIGGVVGAVFYSIFLTEIDKIIKPFNQGKNALYHITYGATLVWVGLVVFLFLSFFILLEKLKPWRSCVRDVN